ncbi:TetR/AcrR family transcriptional regulator [Ruegeria litorea]|uniref:TetR/AcrR family transcriptional regulator n=1 Tax=Falsiruegeria litorea TaxID=1280831 RepID=A0ABS5WS10_9RHOB|nr:TetR/AcrR family transcriptional regulator [Falsiruegeria litorea]MBT3141857.1 TetR/AcrR family transcriptional regulator [Falsiruegeria litorea]
MTREKRKNMKPEDRRNQLLDCAYELFFTKGFEDTTMADILASSGVSKGGFYHHFESKDELVFGIFVRMTTQIAAAMQTIVDDTSKSAVDRLQAIYDLQAQAISAMGPEAVIYTHGALTQVANLGLQALLHRTIAQASMPFLTQLIEDGKTSDEFSVEDAKTTATFITFINNSYDGPLFAALEARGSDQEDTAKRALFAAYEIQFDTINLCLGLSKGTIKHNWSEFVDALLAVPRTKR